MSKAKVAPTGAGHMNRRAVAQQSRTANAEGVEARRELMKQPRLKPRLKNGKGPGHPFGGRNLLLCQARKAKRDGKAGEANKLVQEAAEFAPLTAKEKANFDRC